VNAERLKALRLQLPSCLAGDASLLSLARGVGLDLGDVGAIVGIPARTLAPRKHQRGLSPVESDRLYRLAYVGHVASATLGGITAARLWLGRPNRSLGGATPLSLLDTHAGCSQVEDVLLRLSHGVYA
jgi:putative toxin-antitoxin system antitoxin component (TIGR02293 family)